MHQEIHLALKWKVHRDFYGELLLISTSFSLLLWPFSITEQMSVKSINNINTRLVSILLPFFSHFFHGFFSSREWVKKGHKALLMSLVINWTNIHLNCGSKWDWTPDLILLTSWNSWRQEQMLSKSGFLTLGKWRCQCLRWAAPIGGIMAGSNGGELLRRTFQCSLNVCKPLLSSVPLCLHAN